MHPLRTDLPIYLGAEGPKNVALAAEIADGWLPHLLLAEARRFYRDALAEGFARPGARRTAGRLRGRAVRSRSCRTTTSRPPPTSMRPTLALYIGGMGARSMNFHYDVFARMGYEAECAKIQGLYLDRQQARSDRRRADEARSRTSS